MSQQTPSSSYNFISRWLTGLLDRFQPTEDVVLIGTALVVGLGTGVGAVIFRYLIDAVAWVGYQWIPGITAELGQAYVVFVPALGGLIVGLLIYFFAREAKGHGVPEVMEAVAMRGGRIRPVVAVVKSLASSLTIGSGGSAGREGPIVQIGASLGSTLGQALHLSEDRVRNLVACGAAGGIAATFNAPIAGVMFALEIILGEFSVRYFSSVVISGVVASVIGRIVFGNVPAFPLPVEYGVNSLWEYAFYPLLGIVAAFVGVLFVRMLYGTEDLFDGWKRAPEWLKPAIGATLLGVVALAYPVVTGVTWDNMPQIYNVGYDVIESALSNELLLGTVLVLLVLKLIATSLTLGSGASGGVFAPALFMGAMLGTAFELVINAFFPGVAGPPGAYALLGMAAVFAASAHAPITAVIILFELTDDHRIILPLMLTVVVATVLAQYLLRNESIYTLKLSRRGIRLERGRDVDVMQGVTVGEAMISPAPAISESASLVELRDRLRQSNNRAHCVVNGDNLRGIVTLGDLQQVYERAARDESVHLQEFTVGDICTHSVVTTTPNDALWTAIRNMGARDIGYLPVIQTGTGKLVGMVRRGDIMHAYNMAIARKLRDQHEAERMRLNVLTGAHVFEMHITPGAPVAGKRIEEIEWPSESVVAAIHRNDKLVVPHGNTQLCAGDTLTVVAAPEAEEELTMMFASLHQ